jgi:LPS export ABC transporter protein LptC
VGLGTQPLAQPAAGRKRSRGMKNLAVLTIFGLILACAQTDTPQQEPGVHHYPDTRLDDATIVFTEDGVQSVVLDARHIDRWERQDSTEADTVKIYFYDNEGSLRSSLTANRGLIRERSEKFSVFGNVIAINEDSTILRTESLFWDPETELITTDDYVEIERTTGDIVTGYGLRGDRHLQELEILSEVKGKVIDIPEKDMEKFESDE